MSMEETPRSSRLHIGIFGRTNSGKSSLLNALTNQDFAVVSSVAGTTTDPVYKTMEIHGIGPVVFIDTAGFDDKGELGKQRIEKTEDALEKTDIALVVFSPDSNLDFADEKKWLATLQNDKTPTVCVLNKCDTLNEEQIKSTSSLIEKLSNEKPICVSAKNKDGMEKIREAIIRKMPEDFTTRTITGNLCNEGDTVLLVMPQDIQAPKGRLIVPEMQVTRELLDKKCIVLSCTADKIDETLDALKEPPHLIVTDSQVFKLVYEKKPAKSLLTSFSILMAANKGDIKSYIEGASAISTLTSKSRVLIAEACTHVPLAEDIGREKIPNLLRKKAGKDLQVDIVSGSDWPKDLAKYDLIIHCGGCMFNRAYLLNRQHHAAEANIPMTNYGIAIAYMNDILSKVSIPQ